MNKKLDSTRIEQIEKLMGEPSPLEVTVYEEKIRRNLLLSSIIVFALTYLGLVPSPDSKIFGLSFANLTPKSIYIVLLIVIVYELVHYFWLVINKLAYWRVRLTGTNQGVVRGNSGMRFGNEYEPSDHSGTHENSNFYVWMIESKNKVRPVLNIFDEKWLEMESFAFNLKDTKPEEGRELLTKLNELIELQTQVNSHINNIRLDASMLRFDSWYSMMIRSQSLRWLLLDFMLPLISGCGAIFFLAKNLNICS